MSVAKSSFLFAGGTLISRIAGLIRDRVVLAVFGASPLMDGFLIAFRIPNMLREMLAEGALGGSFTKVYSALNTSDPERAKKLLRDAMLLMFFVMLVISAAGILAAPWIVRLTTSDKETSEALVQTATGLTRVLFPFIGCMSLGAIAMGALHQKGRFFITAVSPLMYNIFSIVGALVLAKMFVAYAPDWTERVFADKAITGLAVGTLLGGLAQLLVQLYGVLGELRAGMRASASPWRWPWSPDLKHMLLLMVPMTLAASAGQINTIINTYYSSSIPGATTWLTTSFRLLQLPIGIFGVAISAAVLPALSRALARAAGKVSGEASREIQNAVELVLWLMVPCFVFYMVNGLDLVKCLFQSGRYTASDAGETAVSLHAYSYALISYGLSKVMTSFYFAMERTKFALRVSLFSVVVTALSNRLLVAQYGHEGIAYGYSIAQGTSVLLLIWGMRGQGVQLNTLRLGRSFGYMAAAALVAAGLMLAISREAAAVPQLASWPIWLASGVVLLVNGVLCVGIFAAGALLVLRLSPREALALLQSRRRRPPPTAPASPA